MKDLKLPHAIVISVVLLVLGTLAFYEKDSAVFVASALTLLGALGFIIRQQSDIKADATAIRQQTNGTNSELLAMVKELAAKVAVMQMPQELTTGDAPSTGEQSLKPGVHD